ncbi:Protein esc1 [Leucoagaricus sp. SymC.cos]|nr:Protein esc1 [Leucoagaricus sp. SymC.cos]
MRRHSIATPNLKRKMSSDRHVFATVGEESDPPLVGPGVPSLMHLDTDAPAPKRRGSAIDTQRIAQLSLNDRRGSADSRSSSLPWWSNERRDSTSSMLSNPSSTGYSSGYTGGDSPHARLPPSIAAFSWPNAENGSEQSLPSLPPPPNTIPPLNYLPDRRMSVPDTLISPPKSIRPRSRPPSRQSQLPEPVTRSSSGQDNSNPSSLHAKKESGATPYSRSPELRVSHKLAERKRRKEMKDLFDELRDQLPADRGMKASKWEILTKAIDFVVQLKQSNQDMMREIERLRQELEIARGGSGSVASFSPGGPPSSHVVYGQSSQVPVVPSQGPPPPLLQPPLPGPSQLPLPRQPTQNVYPSVTSNPSPNGGLHRSDVSPP